jgi:hypothetical protein
VGLAAALEPLGDATELEDADEDDDEEDLLLLPQPAIAAPTTMVATVKPAAVVRASSMGIPSEVVTARYVQ